MPRPSKEEQMKSKERVKLRKERWEISFKLFDEGKTKQDVQDHFNISHGQAVYTYKLWSAARNINEPGSTWKPADRIPSKDNDGILFPKEANKKEIKRRRNLLEDIDFIDIPNLEKWCKRFNKAMPILEETNKGTAF